VRRRRLFVIALCGAGVACSLAVSLDDLENGGGDAGQDAETGAADVATSDGPATDATDAAADAPDRDADADADAAPGDALADTDAPSEAAVDPCTTKHDLCDDFDMGMIGSSPPWTSTVQGTGTYKADPTNSVSPPNSLLVTVTASDGGVPANPSAYLIRTFLGAATGIHCEFDAFFDDEPSSEWQIMTLGVQPANGSSEMTYNLAWEGTEPGLAGSTIFESIQTVDGGVSDRYLSAYGIPSGKWFHAALDATLEHQGPLTLTIDGTPILQSTITPPDAITQTIFRLGVTDAYRSGTVTAWHVQFDNVFCDLRH
jgi:hypothetical protein